MTTLARATDPKTSVQAAASVDLPRSQSEVLAVFYLAARPMADHEMLREAAKYGSAYSPQRLRSARSELTHAGLIRPLESFRPGPSKTRRAHVWALA